MFSLCQNHKETWKFVGKGSAGHTKRLFEKYNNRKNMYQTGTYKLLYMHFELYLLKLMAIWKG